jgi:hypothetical protein
MKKRTHRKGYETDKDKRSTRTIHQAPQPLPVLATAWHAPEAGAFASDAATGQAAQAEREVQGEQKLQWQPQPQASLESGPQWQLWSKVSEKIRGENNHNKEHIGNGKRFT